MSVNADKASPGVLVTLGGKERRIVYTTWSFLQLEKMGQKSLLERGVPYKSLNDLVLLLWAGLIEDFPELDGFIDASGKPEKKVLDAIKTVATWAPTRRLTGELFKAMNDAVTQSLEDGEAEEKKEE